MAIQVPRLPAEVAVGITRAKRDLIISYARRRYGREASPALALSEVLGEAG